MKDFQAEIRNSKSPGACSSDRLERTPDKREVDGSTPSRPTTPRLGGEIRSSNIVMRNGSIFEIRISDLTIGGVAQLGERLPCTQEAIGSNPFTSTRENTRCHMTSCF